jgi:hypothetical protein
MPEKIVKDDRGDGVTVPAVPVLLAVCGVGFILGGVLAGTARAVVGAVLLLCLLVSLLLSLREI